MKRLMERACFSMALMMSGLTPQLAADETPFTPQVVIDQDYLQDAQVQLKLTANIPALFEEALELKATVTKQQLISPAALEDLEDLEEFEDEGALARAKVSDRGTHFSVTFRGSEVLAADFCNPEDQYFLIFDAFDVEAEGDYDFDALEELEELDLENMDENELAMLALKTVAEEFAMSSSDLLLGLPGLALDMDEVREQLAGAAEAGKQLGVEVEGRIMVDAARQLRGRVMVETDMFPLPPELVQQGALMVLPQLAELGVPGLENLSLDMLEGVTAVIKGQASAITLMEEATPYEHSLGLETVAQVTLLDSDMSGLGQIELAFAVEVESKPAA